MIFIGPGSLFFNLTGFDAYYNYLDSRSADLVTLNEFLQKTDTRRAIHVGNNVFSELAVPSLPESNLRSEFMISYAKYIPKLLSYYPILIYNGQLDIISAYPMMENLLNHLNFAGADQYKRSPRHVWRVKNETAGYMRTGGNLTSVLVRNAGKIMIHIFW